MNSTLFASLMTIASAPTRLFVAIGDVGEEPPQFHEIAGLIFPTSEEPEQVFDD